MPEKSFYDMMYAALDKVTKRDSTIKANTDFIAKSILFARGAIAQSDCIIDVGAYKGQVNDTTQRYARAFPQNLVYAIEPGNSAFVELAKNVSDLTNVKCHKVAFGDMECIMKLNVLEADDSSSLCEIDTDASSKIDQKRFSSVFTKEGTEDIRVMRLDDFALENDIRSVVVLKIDTQGFEKKVLAGATKVLERTKIVVVEMSNHEVYKQSPKYYEIDELLRTAGFHLSDLRPSIYNYDRIYEFDSIYEKKTP